MFSWYSLELPSIRLVEAKRNRIRGNDSLSGYFVENNHTIHSTLRSRSISFSASVIPGTRSSEYPFVGIVPRS